MTHTLHRAGKYEDLENDFTVSVMPAKGYNDADAVEKQKAFLAAALKYNPVNVGDSTKGSEYRPSKNLKPTVHWRRESSPDPAKVVAEVDGPTTASAVFDNFESVKNLVAELKELDLGISVNIASVPDKAIECCNECGIARHSVEYSLGFQGSTEKLPDDDTLQLSSMCGHGMVAASLVRKMRDWVKTGRRTPRGASRYMARFCVCGSFNPARAERLLERAAAGK
ncbi:MAG: hypothetical protein ACE5HT_14050 [Gemmatimonadales bacterium]